MTPEQIVMLPLWYVVFLLAVTCHEAAHAWAARLGGDETAYLGGQVSLSPLPHMQRELLGTLLVPLLTYLHMGWMMGWASAPYDPHWEDRHPRRAALMAAAGPLANLALALIAFAVLKAGLASGLWVDAGGVRELSRLVVPIEENAGLVDGVGRFFSVMLTLNLVLFLFNLFPLPPMDGASVISGLFEPARRLREQLRASPMSALAGLVVAWLLFGKIFRPIYGVVLGFLYSVW